MSGLGILQRFHRRIDDEFMLDLISTGFTLPEDYEWFQRSNGVRYCTGSINKRDVVTAAEFRARVSLSERWFVDARFDRDVSPQVERGLMRLDIAHRRPSGFMAFANGTLSPRKSDSDIELGVGWQPSATATPAVSLAIGFLDAFNNLIYEGLGVCPCYADTALVYERVPITLRGAADVLLGSRIRLEMHGAILRPARVRAYEQRDPDSGFRQRERFHYVGVLGEALMARRISVGAFATGVRAEIDRDPIVAGSPQDDFTREEAESQAGIYVLSRIPGGWVIEGWTARAWRSEVLDPADPDVTETDYADAAWSGKLLAGRRPPTGFQATIAFEFDLRDAQRARGQLPAGISVTGHNTRLNPNVGWRFVNGDFMIGVAYDLDGDDEGRANRRFDGARARFVLLW